MALLARLDMSTFLWTFWEPRWLGGLSGGLDGLGRNIHINVDILEGISGLNYLGGNGLNDLGGNDLGLLRGPRWPQ